MKTFIYTGMILGSYLGSQIPALWEDTTFSLWNIIFSVGFAIFGAIAGQKIYQFFN